MFAKTLSPTAQKTLALLGESGLLKKAYLAGGSALALHLGHRYSHDFDFFSRYHLNTQNLVKELSQRGKFEKEMVSSDTILGVFRGIKFSFFYLEYPLIKKTKSFLNIALADSADIGAMKIAAIVDRGTKRDFVDLYFLVQKKYSLEQILAFYEQKYQKLSENVYSILKGLSYFEDAEASQMPSLIEKISWLEVKKLFQKEAVRLGKKYL